MSYENPRRRHRKQIIGEGLIGSSGGNGGNGSGGNGGALINPQDLIRNYIHTNQDNPQLVRHLYNEFNEPDSSSFTPRILLYKQFIDDDNMNNLKLKELFVANFIRLISFDEKDVQILINNNPHNVVMFILGFNITEYDLYIQLLGVNFTNDEESPVFNHDEINLLDFIINNTNNIHNILNYFKQKIGYQFIYYDYILDAYNYTDNTLLDRIQKNYPSLNIVHDLLHTSLSKTEFHVSNVINNDYTPPNINNIYVDQMTGNIYEYDDPITTLYSRYRITIKPKNIFYNIGTEKIDKLSNIVGVYISSCNIPQILTIPKYSGSNYFYIKSNTPGILNNDIMVKINEGQIYDTVDTMILNINKVMEEIKQSSTNILIDTFKIEYNTTTEKTFIHIKLSYNINSIITKLNLISNVANFIGYTESTSFLSYTFPNTIQGNLNTTFVSFTNGEGKISIHILSSSNEPYIICKDIIIADDNENILISELISRINTRISPYFNTFNITGEQQLVLNIIPKNDIWLNYKDAIISISWGININNNINTWSILGLINQYTNIGNTIKSTTPIVDNTVDINNEYIEYNVNPNIIDIGRNYLFKQKIDLTNNTNVTVARYIDHFNERMSNYIFMRQSSNMLLLTPLYNLSISHNDTYTFRINCIDTNPSDQPKYNFFSGKNIYTDTTNGYIEYMSLLPVYSGSYSFKDITFHINLDNNDVPLSSNDIFTYKIDIDIETNVTANNIQSMVNAVRTIIRNTAGYDGYKVIRPFIESDVTFRTGKHPTDLLDPVNYIIFIIQWAPKINIDYKHMELNCNNILKLYNPFDEIYNYNYYTTDSFYLQNNEIRNKNNIPSTNTYIESYNPFEEIPYMYNIDPKFDPLIFISYINIGNIQPTSLKHIGGITFNDNNIRPSMNSSTFYIPLFTLTNYNFTIREFIQLLNKQLEYYNNNGLYLNSLTNSLFIYDTELQEIKLQLNINKIFTSQDFTIDFFTDEIANDLTSPCIQKNGGTPMSISIASRNTLGYLLGYTNGPIYHLKNYYNNNDTSILESNDSPSISLSKQLYIVMETDTGLISSNSTNLYSSNTITDVFIPNKYKIYLPDGTTYDYYSKDLEDAECMQNNIMNEIQIISKEKDYKITFDNNQLNLIQQERDNYILQYSKYYKWDCIKSDNGDILFNGNTNYNTPQSSIYNLSVNDKTNVSYNKTINDTLVNLENYKSLDNITLLGEDNGVTIKQIFIKIYNQYGSVVQFNSPWSIELSLIHGQLIRSTKEPRLLVSADETHYN